MPSKSVTINGMSRQISGISSEDPYFSSINERFEHEFEDFCKLYLRPNDICWDIGANIGVTALIMAGTCPEGIITAVEANRQVYGLLQQNMVDNNISYVNPLNYAIGDRNGRAFFNENSAFGHLASEGTSVTMITPETLLAKTDGTLPNFIKIDCEGYEPFILKSASDIIWRSNALVHFEFNTWCLLHHSRSHPLVFLEWIVETFPETLIVREGGVLERFGKGDLATILHDNIMKYGCVNDIVVSFSSDRIRQ